MAQNVKVCCRYRPPSGNEKVDGSKRAVVIGEDNVSTKVITDDPAGTKTFLFDHVFDVDANQAVVYEHTAKPFVQEIMSGFNCTVFAYGQTGSGKTHTMMGVPDNGKLKGIVPRLVEGIFDMIMESEDNVEFTIKLSFLEIYNERIKDLLDPEKDNLKIRESSMGVYVEDVTAHYIASFEEVLDVMSHGNENRAMASTNMNETSSRSHSVFILTLGQTDRDTGSRKGAKLTLVDLAGSEKVQKTGAAGQTLKEAMHINKSLSALGNVINALTSRTGHIPYRDSKLTRLLTDSLGGNSKTCLIITASPMSSNVDETISTLRFGSRAKKIQNKPKINQEKSVAEYKRLLAERDRKLASQAALIQVLEADVAALSAALKAVDPEHLKGPIPDLLSIAIRKQLGSSLSAVSKVDRDILDAAASPSRETSRDYYYSGDEADEREDGTPQTAPVGDSEEADEDEDSGDDAAHVARRQAATPQVQATQTLETQKKQGTDNKDTHDSEAKVKLPMGKQGSVAHLLEGIEDDNSNLREEMQKLKSQIKSLQHEKTDLQKQLQSEHLAAKAAIEARHLEVEQKAIQVDARQEKLAEQEAEVVSKTFELELLKKKIGIQEKEHALALQNASAEKDEILLALQKAQEKALEQAQASPVKAQDPSSPQPPEQQISKMQKDMKKTQDDYSYLHRALKKKCDQYMHLQLIYQDTRDHSALLEKALKDVQKKLINAKSKGDKQKIKDLENRLAESQEICEKLFESGLYWRQKRFLSGDKIRKPLFGGGGKGEKKSRSSVMPRTASAIDNLLATPPPSKEGSKKTLHKPSTGMNQFF
eukprot:gb/GEZN01001896.1/.p1 GENE.gb/GEZN01001896.1/~~gb/GEZN01001896.1/.p1  ORF type:complete len:820 (-),score=150.60 gb/GEZN01001896.1/:200-2659(-)